MRRQNKLLCHHEGFPATSQMSSHHTAGWAVNVGMTFCWSLLHPRCFEFERLWSFNSFSSSFESISRFQGHVYSGAGFSPPWRFRFVSLHLTLTSEQWQKYLETSPHAQVLEEYCRGIKQLRQSQIFFFSVPMRQLSLLVVVRRCILFQWIQDYTVVQRDISGLSTTLKGNNNLFKYILATFLWLSSLWSGRLQKGHLDFTNRSSTVIFLHVHKNVYNIFHFTL